MRRDRLRHIAIPLVVFVLTLALIAAPESESGRDSHGVDAVAVVLAALTALPLLARHRAPLLAFAASTAASSALFALDYPPGPPVGPTFALFFVALNGADGFRQRLLTLAVVITFFSIHVAAYGLAHDIFPGGEIVLGTAAWSGVWLAGDRTRIRRERMAELEERARRAEREAERERRLAAAEERTRIARDLHDSAGHAINVILVHAGAARLLADKDPSRAREALATIESVAGETLREIDQLVGALRDDEERAQTPIGLAALDGLVQRHEAAGLAVDVSIDGARRPLGPAVDQAAYRILQESLTNALRHGDGAVKVALAYGVDALEITVTNPAANGAGPAGHGIVGMRERASLLGGHVDAESVDGVFRVRASLPYAAEGER